jgi:hypothetical protein
VKSLAERLLLKPDAAAAVINAPDEVAADIPATHSLKIPGKGKVALDWLLVFARDRAAVARRGPQAVRVIRFDGVLWFAYPKLTGAIESDLTRDKGWGPVKALGFEAVAAVSIDGTWSALRFRPQEKIGRK